MRSIGGNATVFGLLLKSHVPDVLSLVAVGMS